MNESNGFLLLDTHCWLWTEFGIADELPPATRHVIQEAAAQDRLLVSVISVWEIGLLESKGRVRLELPVREWVERALATPGLSLAPLTVEIALDSTRLPGEFHGDPADRILVATARHMGARLLTRDRRIIEYGETRHVRVMRA